MSAPEFTQVEEHTYWGVGMAGWLFALAGFISLCYSASDVAMVLFAGVVICWAIRFVMRMGVQDRNRRV